jgi:pimeloyl-ACP methyl ester carboxylesterase
MTVDWTKHQLARCAVAAALGLCVTACSEDDSNGSDSSGNEAAGTGGTAGRTQSAGGSSGAKAGSGASGARAAGSSAAGAAGKGAAGASGTSAADVDAGQGEGGSRDQDARKFTFDATTAEFAALPNVETDRAWGVLDGAGYQIEVPKEWNGILVMYAHGYAGTGEALRITTPGLRAHLIEKGYAWAASSYSKNYYDVRVGVEDTNKLALAFTRLVGEKGRKLDEPKKRYLIGHSMGGHITGAAIEKEAQETAANKVHYAGAVPMCGVMGDTELFNYFTAYQFAAQKLANISPDAAPADFAAIKMPLRDAIFSTYPTATTPAGDKVKKIVANLTGGSRPMFELGFAAMQWQDAVWNVFGGDGRINGILEKPVIDTRKIVYQLDDDAAQSAEEKAFNETVYRVSPASDANPIQPDGVRFIPVVNGEFDIPVVSLHTLGDLYVPFKMQQVYRERAIAKGNQDHLVQRAIRGTGHCEFTLAEQITAFDDLARWEQEGVKPEGDEVLDLSVVHAADYGCKFTNNTFTEAEKAAVGAARATAPACPK